MSAERSCGLDVAAYSIGALDDTEARAFAHHLDDCIVCRDELAAFQQVADALPLAARQMPPPSRLRRRVLAEVRRDARRDAGAAHSAARRRQSRFAWRPGLLLRPAGALAGAAAVALGVAGGIELLPGAQGTRVYRAAVGHALVRVSGERGELVVNDLPQPSSGHIYEVWLLRRGRRTPQPTPALFDVTTRGAGSVDVPGSLRGVSQIMVTQEKAGGSQIPHGPPVIVAPLQSS